MDLFSKGSIIRSPGAEEPVIKVKILSVGLRFSHLCFTQSLIKSLEIWKTLPFSPAPCFRINCLSIRQEENILSQRRGAEHVVKSCFIASINSGCDDFPRFNSPRFSERRPGTRAAHRFLGTILADYGTRALPAAPLVGNPESIRPPKGTASAPTHTPGSPGPLIYLNPVFTYVPSGQSGAAGRTRQGCTRRAPRHTMARWTRACRALRHTGHCCKRGEPAGLGSRHPRPGGAAGITSSPPQQRQPRWRMSLFFNYYFPR